MLLNKKFTRQVHELASKLVSTLTEFQEGNQNHDLCVEYALSHFNNHRFLSSDSHKVHKQVIGIIEKFLVHSQPEKSMSFKKSYENFLSNDINETSFSKSSVHYDLIDVLLHLSVHPLEKVYTKNSKSMHVVSKDSFDWTAYLLEDEDIPGCWEWDSSSDESDNLECSQKTENTPVVISEPNKSIQLSSQFFSSDNKRNVASDIVPSYWNFTRISVKPALSCSLSKPHNILLTKANMDEINVMREILWLLSGHKNLFVFPLINGKHSVSPNIHMFHLSNQSLQNSLAEYARCGDIICKLRRFVISIDLHVSCTYESFAASLSLYIEWLMSDMVYLERKMKLQEEIFLLSDLQCELSQHMRILHILNNVFVVSIDLDKKNELTSVKTSRLLFVLYNTLLDESTIFHSSNKQKIELSCVDVIYNLWIDSIRPYLDKIDKWICKGILDDPKSEFVIHRKNAFHDCQHPSFWNEALVPAVDDVEDVCPWFSSMLDVIITGGKSMEILQTLSALRQDERKNFDFVYSFKDSLSQSIYQEFLLRLGVDENRNVATSSKSNALSNVCEKKSDESALLQNSFSKLLTPSAPLEISSRKMTKHFNSLKPLSVLISGALRPVIEFKSNLSNHQLVKVFMEEYDLRQALNLFHNFQLMAWGDVLHQFALGVFVGLQTNSSLLNDLVGINILMQECTSERDMEQRVFVHLKPKSNEEKKDGGLFVTSKKSGEISVVHRSIDATNCIELQWKIEWPLNLVLTESCIGTYNRVFSYLLQIKRAVFCVESLKFSTIYRLSSHRKQATAYASLSDFKPMSCGEKRHRMALLRARLLHLLQHWHGFVMTSVIHAEKHAFETKLDEAKTLDEIMSAHRAFLDRICSLCLLDEKSQASKLVQGTLQKVMTLAITFNLLWNSGIDFVADKSLLTHESTFHECSEFLGRILKTIANRGSIPILDSLAYAILS